MGIFRRQRRGRHAAAEVASAGSAQEGGLPADLVEAFATADSGIGSRLDPGSGHEPESGTGSTPAPMTAVDPSTLRPSGFTPDAVAASIAADAERFVSTFPYTASPVPEGALDFTRASLVHIEAMLSALHLAGRPLPERLHQSIAVYLFETARREFGGRYLRFEGPDPLILLVGEPRASVAVCAMSRVAARVTNGPDDSIIHFYASIAPLIAEGAEITLR